MNSLYNTPSVLIFLHDDIQSAYWNHFSSLFDLNDILVTSLSDLQATNVEHCMLKGPSQVSFNRYSDILHVSRVIIARNMVKR
jgi:hypothetical protein